MSYNPKVIHKFNDDCATQYKSRHFFFCLLETTFPIKDTILSLKNIETVPPKAALDAAGDYITIILI